MIVAWHNSIAPLSFFDRGIPDIIAYLNIAGLTVQERFLQALDHAPYHQQVFILPPWADIYINDTERWQTFEEAIAIYKTIKTTYLQLGYEIVELPKAPLAERLRFIIDFFE